MHLVLRTACINQRTNNLRSPERIDLPIHACCQQI
jgi:hypothetical protein